MIKLIFTHLFIGIYSITLCSWAIILAIFDRNGAIIHRFAARPWAKVILWISGIKLQINGLHHISTGIPYIFMSNHQSYFDIFAVLAGLPSNFKFILKQELMKIPLFGQAVRLAGYISIDRSDVRSAIQSMDKAAERIRNGASVLMFPEGTRNPEGQVQAFKKGGFHLALKSGSHIIPVSIINSNKIVPKGERKMYKGTITMNIGEAIPTKDYSKQSLDQLIAHVRDTIINQMID